MKRNIMLLVRLGVSGILLWILAGRMDIAAVRNNLSGIRPGWYGGGLCLGLLSGFLMAWKWRILMYWKRYPLVRLTALTFTGFFVNNFLPSTVGGDIYRIYAVTGSGSRSYQVTGALAAARLTNFYVAFLNIFLFCLFPVTGTILPDRLHISLIIVSAAVLAAGLSVILLPVDGLVNRLPDGNRWSGWLKSFLSSLSGYLNRKSVLGRALVVSVVVQTVICAYIIFMGKSLGFGIHPVVLILSVTAVLLAMMVPVSLNGLGVREGGLVWILGTAGIVQEQALLFSALLFSVSLAQSLVGAAVFLFSSVRKRISGA